ncbi:MAG: ligase-associated DNA damage response DEXH box helicase [Gammaproteobacteria bacterium]|jgi:ATP-dependent Lhr-like helicase|nr:ligase-associated DNA damage response DEXH box helicase [Gammaproteobacteria bacterium]NBD95446.1 ligase-associated DNA damage response DEXH box helicase [Gammaproteobacteria bacterium]
MTHPAERFLDGLGARPQGFQREAWSAWVKGHSGLIHAPTGTGKTLAAWGGPLADALENPPRALAWLWITPLRALAVDTARSLDAPLDVLGFDWRVGLRTGDTSASARRKLRDAPPPAMVTTPESLSLMLSYADADRRLGRLRGVIVDEWHELLGSKRGVLLELALARLRALNPGLQLWGLSATLGNLDEAMETLIGPGRQGRLIAGDLRRDIDVETLLPPAVERFPQAGRTGLVQLPGVIDALDRASSTLLFTNTRSQAELWFRAIQSVAPFADRVALHHGSIDRKSRLDAEAGLRDGRLRCVVATSSLDLGVDFSPVEQVIQVGSPKGIARLMQRAGRSGHRPGQRARLLCVPTHALEILEIAAAREKMAAGEVEARVPPAGCLDVIAQHLVTVALGSGFREAAMREEIAGTRVGRRLGAEQWQWLLDFITRGGPALKAYPDFRRVEIDADGVYRVKDRRIARMHRMSVGTITADASLQVRFRRGARLGHIEERFLTRLKPGETFIFAGRALRLERIRDMTAYVRASSSNKASVPRWAGGRLPLSTLLADSLLELLERCESGRTLPADAAVVAPLLAEQQRRSALPGPGRLVVERISSREGAHLYLFPFAGRLAHEGLAALLAWRIGQRAPRTFSLTVNDYGIELVSQRPVPLDVPTLRELLSPGQLLEDILAALNASEMARHRFRDIARIAGLVFQGYPGRQKGARQVQASSGLMFDVLSEHDPANPLLDQSRREVLEAELEFSRLETCLTALAARDIALTDPGRLTPLAFPLWADRLRGQLSSEQWEDRVERMLDRLDRRPERRTA